MDNQFCPGARVLRQPEPELFPCPACGEEVEIWTDEMSRKCTHCGAKVFKDNVMSCLEWCSMGEECVGTAAYEKFKHVRAQSVREMIYESLKNEVGDDQMAVAERTESIARSLSAQNGSTWHLLMPAALLHIVKDREDVISRILFRTGMKLEHIQEIQELLSGTADPSSLNARLLKESAELAVTQ